MAAIVTAIVLGFGAIGYFVVYPMVLENSEMEPPLLTPTPPASVPLPIPEPAPEPTPESQISTSTTTTTPPFEPLALTPLIRPAAHRSLFTTPADLIEPLALTSVTFGSLTPFITFDTAEVPILRELALSVPGPTEDAARPTISLKEFFAVTGLSMFDEDTLRSLGNDVTVFTYTDTKGTWLGFAVRATDGVALAALRTKLTTTLESNAALTSLFLTDPGSASPWRSGFTNGVENRYQTFTLPGAALNYGWTNRTLIVATSYDAFRAALTRMK
jgi:hypothetical protein